MIRVKEPAHRDAYSGAMVALTHSHPDTPAYDPPRPEDTRLVYPAAASLSADFREQDLREAIDATNGDPIPHQLAVYVGTPLHLHEGSPHPTPRSDAYLMRLYREIGLKAGLFDRDRDVVQLQFGGSTTRYLSPVQIAETVDVLHRHLPFSAAANHEFSIELEPRFFNASDFGVLADAGISRILLTARDDDPQALRAAMSPVRIAATLQLVETCRQSGLRSASLGLHIGLPGQSTDTVMHMLQTVLEASPERLVFHQHADPDLSNTDWNLLLDAITTRLDHAGYQHLGMGRFVQFEQELARAQAQGQLSYNVLGYSTHANCDVIGLGVAACSQTGDCYSQNPVTSTEWAEAVDRGCMPANRGLRLDADQLIRADLVQQLLCRGELDLQDASYRHVVDVEARFPLEFARVAALARLDLVNRQENRIRLTSRGRWFLRIIAACFDCPPATATHADGSSPMPTA